MKVFTTNQDQNFMINLINIKKPPNVSDYLKSLSQSVKDLMNEIEDENDDIDDGKLLFIGSNKERFNFNIFNSPLNFISANYSSKISWKETEIKQRDLVIK